MTNPYFDAHCDTPVPVHFLNGKLYQNSFHLDLKRLSTYAPCAQVFAVCVNHGTDMVQQTENVIRTFLCELDENCDTVQLCLSAEDVAAANDSGKIAALLSVEGADRLGDSIDGLRRFYELGVRIVHITWNDETSLCGTALGSGKGLTEKGREFVSAAQHMGVVLDMSHISEQGFWDVLEIAEKPVLAGHSNALSICPFPRNLSDAQFSALVRTGGVAGLNFCCDFLDLTRDVEAIVAHAEHWLGLGGEKAVCLGTDFDGISELPGGITGVESLGELYNAMLARNWSESLVQDIFYRNLFGFFHRALP